MCGLLGAITLRKGSPTNITLTRDFIEKGLYVSALRGVHGAGLAVMHHDNHSMEYFKAGLPSSYFISLAPFRTMHSNMDKHKYVLAHVRATTIGQTSNENAHPFSEGPILLAHNGTIKNTWDINKNKHKYDVDSQLVAKCLADEEIGDAKKVLEELEGSYVLTWMDKRDKSFNIARNKERPLFYCISKNKDTLYYMSEIEMLDLMAIHCNNGADLGQIFEFKEGIHYKYLPNGEETQFPFVVKVPTPIITHSDRSRKWLDTQPTTPIIHPIAPGTTEVTAPASVEKLKKVDGVSYGEPKTVIRTKTWIEFEYQKYESERGGRILGTIPGVGRLTVVCYSPDLEKVSMEEGNHLLGQCSSIFQGGTEESPMFYMFVTRVRDKKGFEINQQRTGLLQIKQHEKLIDCDFCGNPTEPAELVSNSGYKLCSECLKTTTTI